MKPASATDKQLAKVLPAAYQGLDGLDVMTIRPIYSRVLIRDIHDDTKIGAIFVPDSAEPDRKRIGEVVAVGAGDKWFQRGQRYTSLKGIELLPTEVRPGDKVIYERRREAEIEIGGERLTLAYEEQAILGILED